MPQKKRLRTNEVLRHIFEQKCKKNSHYSLRAFARDLNISPGRLSVILTGKEEPGKRSLTNILNSAKISSEEKSLLTRSLAQKRGFDNDSLETNSDLTVDDYEELHSIDCHAILSLIRTEGSTDDHQWIAARLNIPRERVDHCILALLKNKVITRKKGCYSQRIRGLIHKGKNHASDKIAKSYQDYLYRTVPQLLEMDQRHSMFATLTIPLNPDDLLRVRHILQSAFKKIKEISDQSERTEVYNFCLIGQKMTK